MNTSRARVVWPAVLVLAACGEPWGPFSGGELTGRRTAPPAGVTSRTWGSSMPGRRTPNSTFQRGMQENPNAAAEFGAALRSRPASPASLSEIEGQAQSGRRRRAPVAGGPAAAVAARAMWKTASRRQAAPNGTSAMPTPGSPL